MTTYWEEERRIQEDDDRDLVERVRNARAEDERLVLREAGSVGAGLAAIAPYVPHTYRVDSAELAELAPSELIERIHSIARSRHMYADEGGPKWCIAFCSDALAAAERELAGRLKETT